jgi:hypothetical protein
LLGLLFVSASLNLGRILPGPALLATLLLLTVLIVASLMLVTGQPATTNAIEILVGGLLVFGAAVMAKTRDLWRSITDRQSHFIQDLAFLAIATRSLSRRRRPAARGQRSGALLAGRRDDPVHP